MRFIKKSNFLIIKLCINAKLQKRSFCLHSHAHATYFRALCFIINRVNQQETKSLRGFAASSETVRRITFQFSNYNQVKPQHKTATNQTEFLTWFIGFVEGHGSFVVSHNKVYFDLTQHLKHINLLYKIKTTLGFGTVLKRIHNDRYVAVFYVTGKNNFIRLAHLFNANLLSSNKKNQFKKWLTVLNAQYDQRICYIDNAITPCFNNAWLCGFIDAQGCFSARLKTCKTSKLGSNLFVDFSLNQKSCDILQLIKKLFGLKKRGHISFDPSCNGYRFYFSNKKVNMLLIRYLNNYALKTKKIIDFVTWAKINELGLQKIHLTPHGLIKVGQLCHKLAAETKRLAS